MSELNSEAKTIISRLVVENGGSDLSSLPPWICSKEAQNYVQHLSEDGEMHEFPNREIDQIMQQDIVSRREVKIESE